MDSRSLKQPLLDFSHFDHPDYGLGRASRVHVRAFSFRDRRKIEKQKIRSKDAQKGRNRNFPLLGTRISQFFPNAIRPRQPSWGDAPRRAAACVNEAIYRIHHVRRDRCLPCPATRPPAAAPAPSICCRFEARSCSLGFIPTPPARRSAADLVPGRGSAASGASSGPILLPGFAPHILRPHGCSWVPW